MRFFFFFFNKQSCYFHNTTITIVLFFIFIGNLAVNALTVAVFGGSGFVGRRICQTLVETGAYDEVISISKSGKPPTYYCINTESPQNTDWSNHVTWIQHKVTINDDESEETPPLNLPPVDVAISCIGNLQPNPQWTKSSLFGLRFNDTRLFEENGLINEKVAKIAKNAGAQRFVFLSVSYQVAKMLEGPIEGYMNGKRHAESAASRLFGEDNTIVLGPSLIYGGKRFAKLGQTYRTLVESPVARAYVAGNDALRNLSVAPMEDWVEKTLFSPPVNVSVVAKVAAAAALGMINRSLVGNRKQGFYDTNGKPVQYDNVLYIDGTLELERIVNNVVILPKEEEVATSTDKSSIHYEYQVESPPIFEGALIGKKPLLYPLVTSSIMAVIFYGIVTGQFVATTTIMSVTTT